MNEPSNGELERQIKGVNGAISDLRIVVSSLGTELRQYIRELVNDRDALNAERIRGVVDRVARLEKDGEDRDRREEDRERERTKELAEHHRTNKILMWTVAAAVVGAATTVVLTVLLVHGGSH